jgi:hypothetical protein
VYSMQLESPATPTKQTPPPTATVYSSVVVSDANLPSSLTSVEAGLVPPSGRDRADFDSAPAADSALPPRRGAHLRGAQADNTVRPTTPIWLQLCPDFIRDRFANHSCSGKAVASHTSCASASRTP